MRHLSGVLLALVLIPIRPPLTTSAAQAPPRLVVVLVVDQMRGTITSTTTVGAGRGGCAASCRRARASGMRRIPYFNTVTCAGHATIGTGTVPPHFSGSF